MSLSSQPAKTTRPPRCIVIVVAAGRGSRVGGELPKQYLAIAGDPLIRRTLRGFCCHPRIDGVLPVIHADDRTLFEDASQGFDVMEPVFGGDTRQQSVLAGLEHLAGLSPAPDYVLIHDAARAFVSAGLIESVVAALEAHQGAIPALPVVDTLKRVNAEGIVERTVDRSVLWRAQTPQGFHFAEILAAHREFENENLTDDSALAERAGLGVVLVAGEERNVKITTSEDIDAANARLHVGETRTGQGFDVHRFCPGEFVTLCGIEVPHSHSLEGHSDADVAMHALTDALLGAMAEGDIGDHFPPSEEKWRGVSSDVFLGTVRDMLAEKNGRIVNVDVTIVCEAPKIGPHRDTMIARLADVLGIDAARVSVKATTTEKLGFTGRSEGIAAQAVATVVLPSVQ